MAAAQRPNAGDDSAPHSGEGGPRRTPTQLAADPAFTGTYATILTPPSSVTYNTDGTVATQTVAGVTTSYTYNTDGTVATEVRAGVTRTYTYNPDGTLASVA